MKLYLDDLRIPQDNYDVIVRSYEEVIYYGCKRFNNLSIKRITKLKY